MAKLTFRLVPNQKGDAIVDLVKKHFQKNLPPGVMVEMQSGHSGPWYLTDPNSKFGKAAQSALKKTFNKDVALIREGGSIPIVSDFRNTLGVETLLIGLALQDCKAHPAYAHLPSQNLQSGILMQR